MADSSTRTVERALTLLGAVCAQGAIALGEAAREADLSPSTALRLLRTLEGAGFIRRDDNGDFRPSARVIQLGALALSQQSIVSLCAEAMKMLVAVTGESCYLSIPGAGDTCLYIAIVEGTNSVRHASWVGRTIPLDGTAAGSILRGQCPPEGYTVVRSGVEDDVTAIAAPVVMGGRIAAALSIVVPSYRLSESKAVKIGERLALEADSILLERSEAREMSRERVETK